MEFNLKEAKWFFEPNKYQIKNDKVIISTEPHTDFWQRTYYEFKNDNAHVLYNTTEEEFFSFTVKTHFEYNTLFDQCGIVIYQDSENWVKAGIEFHNKDTMWYRLSRRKSDFLIEHSFDGVNYKQMRIFHLFKGEGKINFGLLACSPGNSSFDAFFTDMKITECMWAKHEG